MKKGLWVGCFLLALIGWSLNAEAVERFVDLNAANPTPPYTSWATAAANIQTAVDASLDGDTVVVTNGHYLLSSEIGVNKNITIRSVNGAEVTIVDGGGTTRCFKLNRNCLISGFTITNGFVAHANGGGVYCDDTFPVIENCIISGNMAGTGGINYGGGVYYGTIKNCLVKNNSAHSGSGLAYSVASRCMITGNFSTTTVGEGGGMRYGSANNCLISGNHAGWKGGGVSGVTANNCIIVDNSSDLGGGVYSGTVRNCIVWYNGGGDLYGATTLYSSSPRLEHGVDGNITNAPLLVSASHIATNSPCRGVGSAAYATGTDIDGEIWLAPPSMGCDEIPGVVTGTVYLAISGPLDIRAGFEAKYAIDVVGAVTGTVWDFGDGTVITNAIQPMLHAWSAPGNYDMILTAFSDEYSSGTSITQHVAVLSEAETAIYVSDTNGNDLNDGHSWATAKKTIQAGVDAQVIRGGIVLVSNGTYAVDSEILVTKDISIASLNGPEETIVDGGGITRCFNLTDRDCLIRGFTITNGSSADYGGGIGCWDASPAVVENCIITRNSAAYNGGGMSDGIANNCIITENVSGSDGGGMSGGTANNCTIRGNSAIQYGGGIRGGSANNCIVSANSARYGGGMVSGTANNCAIFGNSAERSGGGMYDGTANNCTMVENTASYAGGMYRGTANNCIVWQNWYYARETDYESNLRNTITHYTSSSDVTHGVDGNITNAPQLISTSHIEPGSPCRGAGSPLYSNGVDIDGEAWLNPPSMGCDEYAGVGSATGMVNVAFNGIFKVIESYPSGFSSEIEGSVTMHVWDFGDGSQITNNLHPFHAWSVPGNYAVVLTAFSDTYPTGVSVTQVVEVVSASGSEIHVSGQTGSDANDGLGWATAKATIQAGVEAQNILHGTVLISNGIYAISSEIKVNKDVVIQSIGGPEATYVDGSGSNRCFNLEAVICGISGFTVTNGYIYGGEPGSADGGGIYCSTRYPVVENCIIVGNLAASNGGGMYRGTAENCTIKSNFSRSGGGIYSCAANNCTISGNKADSSGGGMYYGTADNCTIASNSAWYGGGMYRGTANNCTITSNFAWSGAGIYKGTAINCTISANRADIDGGGMHEGMADNCIIWYNTVDRGWNNLAGVAVNHSCSPDVMLGENGNITNAPLFMDRAEGDYHLQSNSPCINWGNNAFVSGTEDLDGNSRIVEIYVDMGAYEYQGILGLADSDGDGLLDDWEREWFGGNVLPDANPDGDISPNSDEFVAGTDPTNSASFFQTAARASEAGFVIEWTATTGRVYNVYWKPSLTDEFQPLETGITYPQHSYTDTVHSAESSGFYRVVVMRSDYDADGDGLPNDWESQYAVADAFADEDGDGADNLSEFIAGTDPTNSTSFFAVTHSLAEVDGTHFFAVEWISVPDRLYSVQWSTNLVDGFQTLESNIEFPQASYTDTLHNAEAESFYKVDVRLK